MECFYYYILLLILIIHMSLNIREIIDYNKKLLMQIAEDLKYIKHKLKNKI